MPNRLRGFENFKRSFCDMQLMSGWGLSLLDIWYLWHLMSPLDIFYLWHLTVAESVVYLIVVAEWLDMCGIGVGVSMIRWTELACMKMSRSRVEEFFGLSDPSVPLFFFSLFLGQEWLCLWVLITVVWCVLVFSSSFVLYFDLLSSVCLFFLLHLFYILIYFISFSFDRFG